MKTIVILNAVPVAGVKVTGGKLDYGDEFRIGPASRSALVLALNLSDEVIALAFGMGSEDVLREALAYGAKRAIILADADNGFARDPLTDAHVLNKAIHELAGDEAAIVFCGTGDDTLSPGVSNPLGAALAGLSGLQYVGGVVSAKAAGDILVITARSGDALLTIKAADNPALVLGVGDAAIAAHTLPWAGGIINAYREGKVETMNVEAEAGTPALTLNQLAPSPKREGPELLTDPPVEAAAALVEMLRSRAII